MLNVVDTVGTGHDGTQGTDPLTVAGYQYQQLKQYRLWGVLPRRLIGVPCASFRITE